MALGGALLPLLLLQWLVGGGTSGGTDDGPLEGFIVFLDPSQKPAAHASHAVWHAAHLRSLSIDPARHLLYSYSVAAHGYAAALRRRHLPLLRASPAVLRLLPDPLLRLHTTRSADFLGLNLDLSAAASSVLRAAEDVVIGVLDTGVWPESASFSDAGMPPVPARWRGACEPAPDFPASLCNRKLVGARSFSRGRRAAGSARDRDGHGTHTASTAAGARVANASLLGYARGTARGMAAAARVAAYKVCGAGGCLGSDILAGMESAIADGVDVLSLSLGGAAGPYFQDVIAIGALAAVERGVLVACSAGNSGPAGGSLANAAPWILTVGAGTLDREFPAVAVVGGGARFSGVSLYSGPGTGTVGLVYEPPARNGSGGGGGGLCLAGTLAPARVRGKVVVCDRGVNARVEKGELVRAAGGVGMILANSAANGEELVADSHLLPAVAVGLKTGNLIRSYAMKERGRAKVRLEFDGTVLGVRPSPVAAAFSSRGPNVVTPEILKPDLIGPGVNILAAWSGAVGPTGLASDPRRSQFNIMSGTSMACPHVSGIVALVKAAHPEWSPAAVRSALMTTAYTEDNTGAPLRDAAGGGAANPFVYGSGHVDPTAAIAPGLVYDISADDYATFLCSLNYGPRQIQAITRRSNCSRRLTSPGDLNYPSFSVLFDVDRGKRVKYSRELTNVGDGAAVYEVEVRAPPIVAVSVTPKKLVFTRTGQKLKFGVSFSHAEKGRHPAVPSFGWITWSSAQRRHPVRSPVTCSW
ncbi:subtilisin-like protease SBT1.8 [Wolffia australiana]